MGWSGIAISAFADRLGGENTFLRKGSFLLEQFAETYIAIPDHPIPARIFENVTISLFSSLTS